VSTFSRFFRKIKRGIIEEAFPVLNGWLLELRESEIPADGITLDLDSSVFERYGAQEGADVGYNPKRPGRPSHHPIFAMLSDIKFLTHFWLRRGKTVSISGAKEFLEETLLEKIVTRAKRLGLYYYIQTDCRGATVYLDTIGHPGK